MFYRLFTSLLLIIYLSIYSAIILCDLQCDISSKGEGINNDIEDISHYHSHPPPGDTDPHPSHHSHNDTIGKHLICLYAHSASSNGILTNARHITGISAVTMSQTLHEEKVISQTLDSNIHSRAPPLSSFC